MRFEGFTIRRCLQDTSLPRLELQLLLAKVLDQRREWLIAHDDHVLTSEQSEQFDVLYAHRLAGEPMAYLLEQREFMGLSFEVNPAVLIPRPETELLVQTVLERVVQIRQPRILDLGTGSGAIAVSLAHTRPDAVVWATDISQPAIALAKRNAQRHGVAIECHVGNWFEALPVDTLPFDVIVSNPPYIHPDDDHLRQGDLRFEPRQALTEGIDGLSVYRTLAESAAQHLVPGGWLCVEHGFDQSRDINAIFEDAGLQTVETLSDLSGHPRVTAGSYNT